MANFGKIIINKEDNTSFLRLRSLLSDNLYKFDIADTNYLLKQIVNYQSNDSSLYPEFNIVDSENKIFIPITDIEHLNLIKRAIPRLNPKSVKAIRRNKYSGIAAVITATAITLSSVGVIPTVFKKVSSNTSFKNKKASSMIDDSNLVKNVHDGLNNSLDIIVDEPAYNEILKSIQEINKQKDEEKKKKKEEQEKEAQRSFNIYNTVYTNFDLNDVSLKNYDYEKYQIAVDKYYDLFEKYGNRYGVDPLLLSYIATQERGVHSKKIDSGGAIGLCQIQAKFHHVALENYDNWQTKPFHELLNESLIYEIENKKISAYNFETGKSEKYISMSTNTRNSFDHWLNKTPGVIDMAKLENKKSNKSDNLIIKDISKLEDNIQYSAMIFSQHLKDFKGNIKLALFAYNQGKDKVEQYINNYAYNKGISYDEAMNSIPDKQLVLMVPKKHGDKNYLSHVLSNAIASGNPNITCFYRDDNNNVHECKLNIKSDNIHSKTK